jgi:hypothetical protein
MNTQQRPAVVTIAAILLIILSLFVGGLGIASQYGLLGLGPGNRQFLAGRFAGRNFPQGGFPSGGFPSGGIPNDQNNTGQTPNFTPNRQLGTGLARLLRLIRPVMTVLNGLLIVVGVVAAIGLFKTKRWGVILAIILSALLFLLAIPGMLRIFSVLTAVENVVRMLLALAVIVLLLLPQARKAYARPVEEIE